MIQYLICWRAILIFTITIFWHDWVNNQIQWSIEWAGCVKSFTLTSPQDGNNERGRKKREKKAFQLRDQSSSPTSGPGNKRHPAWEGRGGIDRVEEPGCSKWNPGWEFPCQWVHLTPSLMDHGDVPLGPDGIQWSARWQLVKGGQASCIMEAQRNTPQPDCCADVEVVPSQCQYCRNINWCYRPALRVGPQSFSLSNKWSYNKDCHQNV